MSTRGWISWWLACGLAGCQADCPNTLQDTRARPEVSPQPTLDFGTVDVTQRKTMSIALTNNGDHAYNDLTFTLSADTAPEFSLQQDPPRSVPALGGRKGVEITILPRTASEFTGKLTIHGRVADDGAAEPHWQDFTVNLVAMAINNGLPRIEVEPMAVEFGRVAVNDVTRRDVTIRNTGVRDLIVEDVVLDADADAPFHCATCASMRTVLVPSASVTVQVTFSPPTLQEYASRLLVHSIDPANPEVEVTLHGFGQVAPVACITFLDDVSALRPMETVRVDGACSRTEVPQSWLQHYEWELSYRPPGSTTVLRSVVPARNGPTGRALDVECPDTADTGATPCSTRIDTVADVAGTYEVSLTVVDNNGIRSAPTSVHYRAVPTEALHVQLVWDHPTADLDLHFMLGSGPPFVHATDAYFSNRFPDWFGSNPDSRNPRLDVDDQGGFGPENTNVIAPAAGRYRVAVHYWNKKTDGDPATLATVRIYVRGQLALDQGQFFQSDQQMWTVADIDWPTDPEAPPTINPVGDVVTYPRPF